MIDRNMASLQLVGIAMRIVHLPLLVIAPQPASYSRAHEFRNAFTAMTTQNAVTGSCVQEIEGSNNNNRKLGGPSI